MGAIMNGIALHGGTRVYGGTFLVFSDYMRGAVRLAALMKLPVTYVWTHDSIGLGEDGPTHQPIEHLAALRAIPGLDVVRPADANETAVAWRTILEHTDRPAALALSRQNVPIFDRAQYDLGRTAWQGRRTSSPTPSAGTPEVILIATGSEVQLAVAARERLEAEGTPTRVVSMPCREWFPEQDPPTSSRPAADVKARVSVEAGVPHGLARVRRRRRRDRRPRALRRERRTTCCTSSSVSPERRRRRPRGIAARRPAAPSGRSGRSHRQAPLRHW